MEIASLIFIILFGVSSLLHLYFCFIENEKLRHISKPFCVSFLALAALFYLPTEPFIYLGALLGVGGDILMLFKKKKIPFAIGTVLFFIGHIFYMIAAFRSYLSSYVIPYWIYLILFGAIILIMFSIYPFTKKISHTFALPGGAYFALLGIMTGIGVVLIFTHSDKILASILFTLGYLLFLMSDTILTITTFIKDVKRRDFYIMFTYLAAQGLIVSGLCLLLN